MISKMALVETSSSRPKSRILGLAVSLLQLWLGMLLVEMVRVAMMALMSLSMLVLRLSTIHLPQTPGRLLKLLLVPAGELA